MFSQPRKFLQLAREIAQFSNSAKNGVSQYLGNSRVLTAIFTGQLMVVSSRDFSVSPHLIAKGEWELGYTQYFRSLVRPNSKVLDGGANFGYYGIVSSTNNAEGSITFVEANPDLIDFLRINCHLSGIESRAHIEWAALNDVPGELALHVPSDFWGSARIGGDEVPGVYRELWGLDSAETRVPATTIDFLAEKLGHGFDVIKLDIEGGEELALRGGLQTIRQQPQVDVFLEYSFGTPGVPEGAYTENFWEMLTAEFNELRLVKPDGESFKVNDSHQMLYRDNQNYAMLHASRRN